MTLTPLVSPDMEPRFPALSAVPAGAVALKRHRIRSVQAGLRFFPLDGGHLQRGMERREKKKRSILFKISTWGKNIRGTFMLSPGE